MAGITYTKHFVPFNEFVLPNINFTLGADRKGQTTIVMTYSPAGGEVAVTSCPAITMWPRCTGDGNFGTMWGPTDVTKAKFTLDLSDAPINEQPNLKFEEFKAFLTAVDDRLLDFVAENQQKVLNRKNLSKEEVKMLQIRSVRPKYDKITGTLTGHSVNLSSAKYAWDGLGGKHARRIVICDHKGQTLPNGTVSPGDVVAATMYANLVYTGVGGDKFGIHWSFMDVQVICQRANMAMRPEVSAFTGADWSFSRPYVDQSSELGAGFDATQQFAEPTAA